MKDSKQFWDKRAEKYVKSPIKDKTTYQQKLTITREYLNVENQLLEFGCGSGGTAILHAPFVQSIYATDISDKMIEIAKQKAIEAGVENINFQQGTLDSLNARNESFDVVLGLNVLHLLKDVDGAINKVHQFLKSGGFFVSSTSLIGEVNIVFRWLISAMQYLHLAPHVTNFTEEQLIHKLVKAGFSIERKLRTSSESVFIVAKKVS
ncbi:MAG: class I SAM-dependent methyltransferase [Kangiellaceae bacterium]|nr:class I SAM-dependent methyltransferase [Kangiellaceae bacterium]